MVSPVHFALVGNPLIGQLRSNDDVIKPIYVSTGGFSRRFLGAVLMKEPKPGYPQNKKLHGFRPLFGGWTQIHFRKNENFKLAIG